MNPCILTRANIRIYTHTHQLIGQHCIVIQILKHNWYANCYTLPILTVRTLILKYLLLFAVEWEKEICLFSPQNSRLEGHNMQKVNSPQLGDYMVELSQLKSLLVTTFKASMHAALYLCIFMCMAELMSNGITDMKLILFNAIWYGA